jgi:hypothetical protein
MRLRTAPTMFQDYDADDLQVKVSELLVATADHADELVDRQVQDVLRLLRERLGMDVVFVSEFTGGQRMFRYVDHLPGATPVRAGEGNPLEESWCQRVVDGRLPELMRDAAEFVDSGDAPVPGMPVGTHLSTPVRLPNGEAYGTLCCFSVGVKPGVGEADLRNLRYTAKLLAGKLAPEAPRRAPLSLQPVEDRGFKGRL